MIFSKIWKVIDLKMADINEFLKRYSKYYTSFKVTSYDSLNKKPLCFDETIKNIDFDKIIADIYPNSKEYRPKSFDSIYISGENIYCIEFKNEKTPNKVEIEEKLIDGKNELDKIFQELNIQKREYKFIFCLVYKKHKPREERFKRGIQSYPIKAHLQKYKENRFIDDIFTEDILFFSNQFKNRFKQKLECSLKEKR